MKYLRYNLLIIIVALLSSCDHTTYVAVRNYKEPATVKVLYRKPGSTYFDNDTLMLKTISEPGYDSSLVRFNTSDSTYSFNAPTGKEVALKPVSLGTPVKQIKIINSSGSEITVDLSGNRKAFLQLKRSGIIKTHGFIFTNSIVIENK